MYFRINADNSCHDTSSDYRHYRLLDILICFMQRMQSSICAINQILSSSFIKQKNASIEFLHNYKSINIKEKYISIK